jgi:hypothetical protein
MDLSYIDVGLRLGAAALAGGMIGINRDLADRPIGTRTLGLVALGAAAVADRSETGPGFLQHLSSRLAWTSAVRLRVSTQHFKICGMTVLPDFGSDHLPLIAELTLEPNCNLPRQPKSRPREYDRNDSQPCY